MKKNLLTKRIEDFALKKIKTEYSQDLIKDGLKIKDALISEFLIHPVTVELNNGPSSKVNTSGTLNYSGNLYSFIGFEKGYDPIRPILDIFLNIDVRLITIGNKLYVSIYGFPTPQKIWDTTPMPWQEGRSWAKGIEEGISGLNYYLFSYSKNFPTSRSGSAIQSKKQILKNGRFERKKYISSLLNKYKNLFKKIGTRSTTKIQFSTEE
jgi:hypothetical protein